ncbi:ankyrin repeat-containing domain protein [Trichoderma evansii]
MEKVQDEKGEFIKGIRAFVYLLQQRTLNLKVLLTSRPQADIKEALDGLLYIEHDKERRECRASLYFENSRYGKISKEHEGSLEWIWTHDQYKEWSKPDASRFLYLQGKPGSGKSTLTRYFRENLSERDPDAKSAMVAKFFYSDRDGELQRSHYNMLRCILYEILGQHEALFYRYFQSEYRDQKLLQEQSSSGPVEWGYESLKRTFSSISDFSPAKRLYIIIDAVDESDDDDRREILNLMFNLCSKSKDCMIKIFLASRPIGILQKNNAREFFGSKFLSIKLQDQTKPDIARFANSFLKDLEFSSFLKQATKYIVENAQGVFLWVQLVKKELLAYDEAGRCAEKDIFEFLKSLPTELEEFYQRMLNKMGRNRADIRDGIKMFQLVLFARRPLAVTELLHALAIPGESGAEFTISNDSFRNSIPPERRITHCGGNFLEIRRSFGTITYEDSTTERDSVQVMHQTVRDFFLRSNGLVATSDFRMSGREAHICISITCIRYLILCASNIAERFPNLKSWTSQHFKDCAQYLHEMPFLNYTLQYLNHHINSCHNDAYVLDITSKFIDELTISPAAYLLQDWVPSCFDNTPFIIKLDDTILDIQSRILLAAVRDGYLIAAKICLAVGAGLNMIEKKAMTPLHHAADNGHEAVVRLMLESGSNLESKEYEYGGRTPLSWAAENGHEAVVRLLLSKGAYLESKEHEYGGRTPLAWAEENGHEAVMKLLLENSTDIESEDEYNGSTSLSWVLR